MKLTLLDRLACALLGAFSGAIYGTLLAVIAGWMTDGHFQAAYVWCTAGVFSAMGFLVGPYVGDVIGSLVHVVYGFFAGILSGETLTAIDPEPRTSGWLRSLFLFGLGTGVVIFLAWR